MRSPLAASFSILFIVAAAASFAGCDSTPTEEVAPPQVAASSSNAPAPPSKADEPTTDSFAPRPPANAPAVDPPDSALAPQSGDFPTLTLNLAPEEGDPAEEPATPTLGDVLGEGALDERGKLRQDFPPPPEIDPARAEAAGLRILDGKHLRLVTDLPSSPEIDSLPALFDEAVPLWGKYLNVPAETFADWKVQGYLMDREEPFRALGLYGGEAPDVRHGYQLGLEFWCRRQEELGYYQRHLFLHEGVHGFMSYCLGGLGPPWYAEGMAELLATHRVENGVLELPVMPQNRDEVRLWGRTKVLRDAYADGTAKMLDEILSFDASAHRQTEAYAWSWAICLFLSEHPASKEFFATLPSRAGDFAGDFTDHVREELAPVRRQLDEDWMLLAAEMDYGYDVVANVPIRKETTDLSSPRTVELSMQSGWQSTGATLEPGNSCRIEATGTGSVTVGDTTIDFGPGGVTLWYFAGRPYGEVQYALVEEDEPLEDRQSPLSLPIPLGEGATAKAEGRTTIYLRVNLPSSLRDEASGRFDVRLTPVE